MIFLNNHVSGFRGSLPWKCRIRFYPPCTYTRENIVTRARSTLMVIIVLGEEDLSLR